MKPVLINMSITVAAVRDDDEACIALVLDDLGLNAEEPHSAIYTLTPDLASEIGFFEISVAAIEYAPDLDRQIVILGEFGDVLICTDSDILSEKIELTMGPLRDMRFIGRDLIACGATLQVFRRRGKNDWEAIGPSETIRADFPGNHMEAICGFSEDEIYAAGRHGVIWWYDGTEWTPVQCPTNFSFLSIVCASDGYTYLGGQGGIIAKGRRDSFVVFSPEEPLKEIWGIQYFGENIYCAMTRALMHWSPEEGLQPVVGAMLKAETFYNLEVGGSVLWSMGEKDVLRFDGGAWARIEQVTVA